MATSFSCKDDDCERCGGQGDGGYPTYRVEESRRLCDECAEEEDKRVLETDAPKKWFCKKHKADLVKVYCRSCQLGICHTCGLTTHRAHQLEDVQVVVDERKEHLFQQLERIFKRESECHSFDTSVSKCVSDVETAFKAVEDKLDVAVNDEFREVEKRRCDEAKKINERANEKIRKILEERDEECKRNNEDAISKEKQIEDRLGTLSNELLRIRNTIDSKIAKLKDTAKGATEAVFVVRGRINEILSGSESELVSSSESVSEAVDSSVSVDLHHDLVDYVTNTARSVKFVRHGAELKVGNLFQVPAKWDLERTISLPPNVTVIPPFRCIGDNRITIRDFHTGSLYVANLNDGEVKKVIPGQQEMYISDCAAFEDGSRAYCNSATECVSLHNGEGKGVKEIPIPGAHISSSVYIAVNKDGLFLAARYRGPNMYVINPLNGKHVNTITLQDKVVEGGIHVAPSGLIVVKTGNAEFTVMEGSQVRNVIRNDRWKEVRGEVDPNTDLLYAMYSTRMDDVIRIDVMTLDGDIVVNDVMTFRRNLMILGLVLTPAGQMVVCDKDKFTVYHSHREVTV